MFSLEDVILYHDKAIELYGGSRGIRDYGLLDAALHRPWQTFGGEDLYPGCFEKAAAIAESVILNHPFIDGNKRTAFLLCEALLENSNYTINEETDVIYDFLIGYLWEN
ncbi:type II toxin-antitoxin system death-on-curing family toxin [Foetidibacter luteolus]|uniref:type II toxin-antitoxin system death-on-curing family toxin n=1 Tax=Foetidibacter luteolus TaxID=2608880 RepID=UPI00129C0662|nr:type II toxin-antitoxin system death-on-curing family toxin [Foetidibacter luteolus]